MDYSPYLFPSLLAATLAFALATAAWRHRDAAGGRWLGLFLLAVALWSICEALEGFGATLSAKMLWSRVKYLGVATIPPLWLLMALDRTGHPPRRLPTALLFVVPLLTTLLAWTNDAHHLIWTGVSLDAGGPLPHLDAEHGVWFWMVHMVYSLALLLLGCGVLLHAMLFSSRLYRRQALTLLLAMLFPLALLGALLLGFDPLAGVDPMPISFALGGAVLVWGLQRYHLASVVPIAYRAVFEQMDESVYVIDRDDRIVDLNRTAVARIGRPAEGLIGRPVREAFADWMAIAPALLEAEEGRWEIEVGTRERPRHVEVRLLALRDAQGRPVGRMIISHDVTERVEQQRRIEHLAHHDPLTGLPNRRFFESRARAELESARARGDGLVLLALDLDRFKQVNDELGHEAGDRLLTLAAARLRRALRSDDVVGRMGGDEFAVLLPRTDVPTAAALAERLRRSLSDPFDLGGRRVTVGVSIGGAASAGAAGPASPEGLFRRADEAMYRAKGAGGGVAFAAEGGADAGARRVEPEKALP